MHALILATSMSPHQPRTVADFLPFDHHLQSRGVDNNKEKKKKKMCLSQCCYSCHLKVILDRMVPSCLQLQDQRQSERLPLAAAAGAEARQLTLEEMLYPPPSWETEAAAMTPSRWRSSPKVCPVNLADLFSDEEEESGSGGGGYSPPGVNDSLVSVSFVSRASLRSLHSVSRRVSFRSPDESDVFIIPARRHSLDDDDDEEWSSDGEKPSRT